MTDPDPPTDPGGGADAGDPAGPERGAGDGREPPDTDRRTQPRLANASDDGSDGDGADRSVADPGALPEPEPIEPEPLRAENVLFVVLGVLGTVALLATAIVPGVL